MSVKRILSTTIAPLALASCAGGLGSTPPVTPGQTAPISATERQQGAQGRTEILNEFGGEYAGRQENYAATVARRVAVQSGLSSDPKAFTVTLLDSPVDNAFATPGGYVYVTRGLMALMNDEAELAAVLGHEVGHVAARHSQTRQQAAQQNGLLGVLGQVLVGATLGNSGLGQLLAQGIGTGTQLATLKYSRSQESQADELGVDYLKGANYDTDALASMLADLAAQNALDQQISGNARTTPEWGSTHPDPASRVRAALAKAQALGGTDLPRNRDAYLSAIDGMLYGDDPKQGIIDARDFLHPTLKIAFTVPAGFTMQNGAQAVTIAGPNTQAQFGSGSYSGNLESYVGSVLRQLAGNNSAVPAGNVQRTTVHGIPAAYTQVRANSGQTPVDVTVFAYDLNGKAYHFVVLTPAGQGLGAAQSMIESFRPLAASDASRIKAKYLRVVTVKSGDTPATIASRMAFDNYKLERFLVLNGLSPNATLRAGDKVKVVTY